MRRLDRRRTITALLFLAPALIVLGVFVIWPVLRSTWVSLTDDTGFGNAEFIGLDNFVAVFSDPRFGNALLNTVIYTLGTAPASIALALLLAITLNRRLPGRGFFRAALFLPFIASLGIISIAWSYMLDPQIGFIAAWLAEWGMPIGNGIRDPALAMPAVILVGIWRNVGFFMVMYLAGLQSIPGDVKEAATIDGAGPVRTFISITWPLLSNTTMFVSIIAVIFSLQAFDQIYVMTAGGPFFRTETLVMLIFKTGIEQFEIGYASAMSWVLVALVLVVSLLQLRFFQKRAVQY
ncbi:carbohydrate ABC transporter permease [Microbacterium sp. A84]|uniref:carbohydrate ABC transporter permease n=1 Tax=Microbacterium sp. A84 TaxID=3450715 RepID=UPI003F43946F